MVGAKILSELPTVQLLDSLPIWPFVLIMTLTALVLYARAVNGNSWTLMFRSTWSNRAAAQLMREERFMENAFSGTLVFVFFMSFALLLFNAQDVFGSFFLGNYPLVTYFVLLLLVAAIYLVKVGALFLLQFVFDSKSVFHEYILVFMNINIVLGICFIPLNLFYEYGLALSKSSMLIVSFSLFVMALVVRYYRIFTIGLQHGVRWYNLILYLCTLEILPVIMIIAVLNNIGLTLNL